MPRFLANDEVGRLRDKLEQRVRPARLVHQRCDALPDRTAIYLLWLSGQRLGEAEEV